MYVPKLTKRKEELELKQREITIIPATKHESSSRYDKLPGKSRVIGYSKVVKGTGAGVQIRKKIRRLIANYTNWDFIEVTTDYCKSENQEETYKNISGILSMVKLGLIDVLIIYTGSDMERTLLLANMIYLYCKHFGVSIYIANNEELFSSKSEDEFII